MSEPVLRLERLEQVVRRAQGHRRHRPRHPARRDARHHRPERCRQDHPHPPDLRRARPRRRPHPVRRPRRHRTCRCRPARTWGSRARSRSRTCCRASRRWRTWRSPCRRARARASISGSRRHAKRRSTRRHGGARTVVDLAARAHTPAGALSHGEKRRLEIAIALAQAPKLLLLDEPMAGAGAEETRRLVATLEAPQAALHHRARRARHAGRVRARRPHLRAGRGPHHRHRHTRGRARRPGRARRLPRRGGMSSPLLAIAGLRGRLRRSAGAVRRRPCGRRGRGGEPDGPQRHGQDHHRARPHGPAARQRRPDPLRRPADRRRAAVPHRPGRHRPGAGGPADLSHPDGRGKPRRHGRQPQRRRATPGRWSASTPSCRALPSAAATSATRSRAASSRCWRSAAPS